MIAIGLSVAGSAMTLGAWILYLRSINRGTVAVYPASSLVAQWLGMLLAVVAVGWSALYGHGPSVTVFIASPLALMLGASFVWLISQRKTPVGDLKVAVGDRLLPFSATTSGGAAFHTDSLVGRRTLLKFYRGAW
ncbi:MAG: hypothetical protein AAGF11_25590 [Myxococcota bacterium]